MNRHLKWGIILFCTALFFGLTGCGREEESMKEALERVRSEGEAEDGQDASSASEAGRTPQELHPAGRARECAADAMETDTPEPVSAVMETGIQVIQSSMTAMEPEEPLMR